jgi:hypothetical protein
VELGLVSVPPRRVRPGREVHPLDEGGSLFFHRYASEVPDRAKYSIDLANVLVHDQTGELFAVHWGRLTVVVRYDADRAGFDDVPGLRTGGTLDGPVDVRGLGTGWALAECFADDLDRHLRYAWEAADARARAAGPAAGDGTGG